MARGRRGWNKRPAAARDDRTRLWCFFRNKRVAFGFALVYLTLFLYSANNSFRDLLFAVNILIFAQLGSGGDVFEGRRAQQLCQNIEFQEQEAAAKDPVKD